jgi:hypothetical protein
MPVGFYAGKNRGGGATSNFIGALRQKTDATVLLGEADNGENWRRFEVYGFSRIADR